MTSPSTPLALLGAAFAVFSGVLLAIPPYLVRKGARPWRDVFGLWVAGWGFLLIGLGTFFAHRGWGGVVVVGVVVSGAGHLLQLRATKERRP